MKNRMHLLTGRASFLCRRPLPLVIILLFCLVLTACQAKSAEQEVTDTDTPVEQEGAESNTHPFSSETFFNSYTDSFPDYTYNGIYSASINGRALTLEDTPENVPEEIIWANYRMPFIGDYESYPALMGSEHMRISAENECEQCLEYGGLFSTLIIHDLSTLSEEDLQTDSYYFSEEAIREQFTSYVWKGILEYGLNEYTVVSADLSFEWTPEQLELGPQIDSGRYERLFLLGKTETDPEWKIYDIYWGETVLNRPTSPNA